MNSQRSSSDLIVFDGYQTAQSHSPWSWVSRLWQRLLKGASLDAWMARLGTLAFGTSDPVIEERRDRQGYPFYQVYDPVSQDHHIFATEAEVRSWLEQRYYS